MGRSAVPLAEIVAYFRRPPALMMQEDNTRPLNVRRSVESELADQRLAARGLAEPRAADAGGAGGGEASGGPGVRRRQPSAEVAASAAHRKKYEAKVDQVGDAVGVNGLVKNWVLGIDLGSDARNGGGARFFCTDPLRVGHQGSPGKVLEENDHPRIEFRYPVKNVHVQLLDMGRAGSEDAEERLIWDADFAQGRRTRRVSNEQPPESGEMTRMEQPCPAVGVPWRVELHVTADDPRPDGSFEGPDHGIDETIQFEVRLFPEGHPLLKRKAWEALTGRAQRVRPYKGNIRDGPFIESRVPPCLVQAALPNWRLHRRPHPSLRRQRTTQAFL